MHDCFISNPTLKFPQGELVIISELAQNNLDNYVENHEGFIKER